LQINKDYILQTESTRDDGKVAINELLKLEILPDSLFSSSDFAAHGAIQELKSKGFRIPDDFCVVGFSNEPFTEFMELSITTVDQSPIEMGKMAAKVFLEKITSKGSFKIEKKVVLTPKLHIRKSSQKIKE